MDDVSLLPPVGASAWDLEMFKHLTEHVRHEGRLLDEYVATAESTDSKALSFLIGMLVDDERRHHRSFEALASSLKSEAELSGAEPVVPRLDLHLVDRDELLDVTRRLLDHEKADAKELKRLAKELRDVQDTTLWGLLVEVMLRDTEKHIAILRFVESHAEPGQPFLRKAKRAGR